MSITKWNNVKTCELLSQNVFGWKRTSNVIFFPQRRMWKVLFESLKQKMYHLSEADTCHELGLLSHTILDLFYKTWLQICLWVLSTKPSWERMGFTFKTENCRDIYLQIKCTFFFSGCWHSCYSKNSTAYEILYIKMSLKESNKAFSKNAWISLGEIWSHFHYNTSIQEKHLWGW